VPSDIVAHRVCVSQCRAVRFSADVLTGNTSLTTGYELAFAGAVIAHELQEQEPHAQNLWRPTAHSFIDRANFIFEVRLSGGAAIIRAGAFSDLITHEDGYLWADVVATASKSGGALMIARIASPSWKPQGRDDWAYCTVARPRWMQV
jgi:hypothetical protein